MKAFEREEVLSEALCCTSFSLPVDPSTERVPLVGLQCAHLNADAARARSELPMENKNKKNISLLLTPRFSLLYLFITTDVN